MTAPTLSPFATAVLTALSELEGGENANKSMDFGRGVSFACKAIRNRIAEAELAVPAVKAPLVKTSYR